MLLWPLVRRATGGPWVSTARATQLINRDDAQVIDVREPGEYERGHVLGAKNLPLARIESGAGDVKRKDKTLILYCESGDRAGKAAAALKKQGYEQGRQPDRRPGRLEAGRPAGGALGGGEGADVLHRGLPVLPVRRAPARAEGRRDVEKVRVDLEPGAARK